MSGKVALNPFMRNRSWFLTTGRQKPLKNVARSYWKDAGKGGGREGASPPRHAPDASSASRLPRSAAGLEDDHPSSSLCCGVRLPLLFAAPRPLPGFRSGREGEAAWGEPGRGAGDAGEGAGGPPLGGGGLCSSSPLPPPLPAWGRADPRVTGKAARRARAEA